MEQRISNYDRLCTQWAQRFMSMDQDALLRKLPELLIEGEYITLRHFDRKYGIHVKTGEIRALEDEQPVSCTTKLNIYTYIWYAKEGAALTGNWVPFSGLRDARPFVPAFQKGVIAAFAETFSGYGKKLRDAAEKMGGILLPYGDVGFQLAGFACIPVQYLFWEGDEDFPAQANILFDYASTDFIHVESVVTIASEGLVRLIRNAGIEPKGSGFHMT